MKLKTNTLIVSLSIAITGLVVLQSCSRDPLSPGYEYMPDMYVSEAYEAYSTSPFSKAGSALQAPAGTIPRFNNESLPFYEPYPFPNTNEGYEAAGLNVKSPFAGSPELLKSGEQIYKNFCIHCHGEKGDGNGILVQRDKFAGVPSYYGAALKDLTEGKMYHTVFYGKNMMGSHASQINFKERWSVIEWVKKLRADGLGTKSVSDSTMKAGSDSLAVVPAPKK
jgi:mono/diheme cytochrome c family protein